MSQIAYVPGAKCPTHQCEGRLIPLPAMESRLWCPECAKGFFRSTTTEPEPTFPKHATRTHNPALADVLESEEQQAIVVMLRGHGFKVWRVGQRNAAGTQDAGVPDIIAMKPGLHLYVECKRPHGGKLSVEQVEFRAMCAAAGVTHLWGARDAILQFLENAA